MSASILTSTKKILGLEEADDGFNLDILSHINLTFSTLTQLGIGPAEGFLVEDAETTWNDFLNGDNRFNSVRTYVYLKVRLLFDPPATSFHIAAMEEQIKQIEWRMSIAREGTEWTEPVPRVAQDPEVIIIPSDRAWYSE